MDKDLINHHRIGHLARGAGSTSNVLYFRGDKLWVACSGDSRAVMGQQRRGEITALDLSNDHKPDLPVERKRIEAAGGVVSAPGPRGLPPSRVWVNGRVGLAMSRSIGDGEAKGFGVVPDPEIKEYSLKPSHANGDGDKFVIVASDGIWEFISSQEACSPPPSSLPPSPEPVAWALSSGRVARLAARLPDPGSRHPNPAPDLLIQIQIQIQSRSRSAPDPGTRSRRPHAVEASRPAFSLPGGHVVADALLAPSGSPPARP